MGPWVETPSVLSIALVAVRGRMGTPWANTPRTLNHSSLGSATLRCMPDAPTLPDSSRAHPQVVNDDKEDIVILFDADGAEVARVSTHDSAKATGKVLLIQGSWEPGWGG